MKNIWERLLLGILEVLMKIYNFLRPYLFDFIPYVEETTTAKCARLFSFPVTYDQYIQSGEKFAGTVLLGIKPRNYVYTYISIFDRYSVTQYL